MVYVVVLGGFLAPIFLVLRLEFLPDVVKTLVTLGLIVGLIVYILKNLLLLMSLDMFLGMLHCRNKARKRFTLPRTFSVPAVERSIARFGRKCRPLALSPQPDLLQYQSRYPITVYASGIEKIIAMYHTERLSMGRYYDIFRSGAANAKRLKGARGHRMLDRTQKKSAYKPGGCDPDICRSGGGGPPRPAVRRGPQGSGGRIRHGVAAMCCGSGKAHLYLRQRTDSLHGIPVSGQESWHPAYPPVSVPRPLPLFQLAGYAGLCLEPGAEP